MSRLGRGWREGAVVAGGSVGAALGGAAGLAIGVEATDDDVGGTSLGADALEQAAINTAIARLAALR